MLPSGTKNAIQLHKENIVGERTIYLKFYLVYRIFQRINKLRILFM
jgi:hypothetical protein